MQIQPTPNYQTFQPAFQSRFVANQTLRKAFNEALLARTEDELEGSRRFANAVRAILNDGKDDVIKVAENGSQTQIYVNGKRIAANTTFINWDKSASGTKRAIIAFAENERGIEPVTRYNNLSKEEVAAVQDIFDRYKKLDPQEKYFVSRLSDIANSVKYGVDKFVAKELENFQTIIFSRKRN